MIYMKLLAGLVGAVWSLVLTEHCVEVTSIWNGISY